MRHHLQRFQRCPPGWVTCIITLSWIVLLTLSISIVLVSLSARVISVNFPQGVSDRTRRPGSDKNGQKQKMSNLSALHRWWCPHPGCCPLVLCRSLLNLYLINIQSLPPLPTSLRHFTPTPTPHQSPTSPNHSISHSFLHLTRPSSFL